MKRKLTIAVSEIARPHVVPQDIEASYRDMVADREPEQETLE
jgi:hypothetical protein